MSARDEMARDIFLADHGQSHANAEQDWDIITHFQGDRTYAHAIADGLLAAGYRKEARDA